MTSCYRWSIMLGLLMIVIVCVQAVPGEAAAAPEPSQEMIAAGAGGGTGGAGLYKTHCLSCHGTDLRGKIGPGLQSIGSRYSQQEISVVISKGRGGMPGFDKKLSPEEIRALAGWLASNK
ncbi:c-type cytochrome [Paenibacillus daejeonensis]|uniref:c-type cytochrome n=1 Tax=Paenibacillus daejeonensis TaxID=135193 RepID=UPI00037AEEC5|nr:cytochrome c [Paenibacillus daejeonensis]